VELKEGEEIKIKIKIKEIMDRSKKAKEILDKLKKFTPVRLNPEKLEGIYLESSRY